MTVQGVAEADAAMRRSERAGRDLGREPELAIEGPLIQSLFRSDRIGTELWILDLTRFLDANRNPLRLKTL